MQILFRETFYLFYLDSSQLMKIILVWKNNKWAIQGSNQGHPACKAGALPLS